MEWVHCNACCARPHPDSPVNFFLTNCGHLYCAGCIENLYNICKMCSSKFAAINLSPPLREDIAIFFADPSEIYQRHQNEFLKIMNFQKGHRSKLLNSYAAIFEKDKSLTTDFENAIARINELEKENTILKTQLKAAVQEKELKMSSYSGPNTLATNNFFSRFGGLPGSVSRVTPPSASHHSVLATSTPLRSNRLSVNPPPSKGRIGKVPGSISSSSCDSGDRGSDSFNSMIHRYERRKLAEDEEPKKRFQPSEFKFGKEKSSENYSVNPGRSVQPLVHGFESSSATGNSSNIGGEKKKFITIKNKTSDMFTHFQNYKSGKR